MIALVCELHSNEALTSNRSATQLTFATNDLLFIKSELEFEVFVSISSLF